jgi:hypothetical protein
MTTMGVSYAGGTPWLTPHGDGRDGRGWHGAIARRTQLHEAFQGHGSQLPLH